MIEIMKNIYILDTKDTTYCFRVMDTGHLEHLYYGPKINLLGGFEPLVEKVVFIGNNQIAYSKKKPKVSLENLCLEMSSLGKGDIREPFIELTHEDGTTTSDFLFQNARVLNSKEPLKTLPSSYENNEDSQGSSRVNCLEIELYDKNYDITLILTYSVFFESNVITRSARVNNTSNHKVILNRIMSGQLDLDTSDYVISTFHGAWAREMNRYDTPAHQGILINDSKAGTSSSRSNPFFMVSKSDTNEDYGDCYGFNLIYSGNHYAAMEVNGMGKLRILNGIQPLGFQYQINPGETFETPETVMSYSDKGYTGMSHNMHHFIRNHIVRGVWKNKVRPVLINSWEANYFNFDEEKLLKQAMVAKNIGIELFVLDDGWFGKRNDATSSLGDWKENKEKLSGGLKGLADKINGLGMDFGIWVEPEMVNEDSDLYRLHPDWAVRIPYVEHSFGRNQMLLDLTREDVRNYIIDEMSQVFSSANITYVKWDMNRIFSDRYTKSLDANRQQEFDHRYIMGLYQVLDTLTNKFPKILFESCASGGNRFDLGMLCYMPQTWASDNTDAICRTAIQTGYSYGYPMSVVGAHVSDIPNHQTLRNVSIDTRFEVAAFGLLGYECNLMELSEEDIETIKKQIIFYKKYRQTLQFGEFYRIKSDENGVYQWLTVDHDKKTALGLYIQKEAIPNLTYWKFRTKGLDNEKRYHFTNLQHSFNVAELGGLIKKITPVRVNDAPEYNIMKTKKLPGEVEDSTAYGNIFNHCGVKLKQAFGGIGFDKDIRIFQDFASRLYIWEEV